jgi:hypothetical protein
MPSGSMRSRIRSSAITWALITAELLAAFALPAAAQSKQPQPSPGQKNCAKTGKQYFDSLHLIGGSLFGTHYDPLSQTCEAEYVVIHANITQLSIDDAMKRETLAMYKASEKSGKLMKC